MSVALTLGGLQALGSLAKAGVDKYQYNQSGLKDAADRARAGLADPSKFGMSAAERRQMMGEAIRSSGNLANIQDPADYARQLAEQRASLGGTYAKESGDRARQQYQDALDLVREDEEARADIRTSLGEGLMMGATSLIGVDEGEANRVMTSSGNLAEELARKAAEENQKLEDEEDEEDEEDGIVPS
tara:strand:+ start:2224 stop:2784 length:561 start_codon:yes stop_codon:yes gene_type:complete